ncbi:MAG: bifunctional methylenetetrahydrofolate dehydrogenase/methenyltetrahydrofolate cyclohydrolase FolD [Bacteroidales bacterium]|nr:bifunctional methylenetetrahydrofolate dehydrogenase/methenyltetrahydrofolate cyclohydrolase FolD [Bacteroidales bacterium]
MILIDGKATSSVIKNEIADRVAGMIDKTGKHPHLAAVLVGDDPASQTYVSHKEKACKQVGIVSSVYRYPETIAEKELMEVIDFLNKDDQIDGYIVQLPLPDHISDDKVISAIDPTKDVDGFHPQNFGRMALNQPAYLSATPSGILKLLERYDIQTEGKHCVVLGRSHIVGLPVSILLQRKAYPGNCTVTICHSRTQNIKEITASADILIAAIGQQEFVTGDMVKDDAVVIDVGIHRIKSDKTKSGYKLIGDVKFDEVSKKAGYITPVPGGVGPMTIVALLENTVKAAYQEVYQ